MTNRNTATVRLTEGFCLKDVIGDGAPFSVGPLNMSEAELEPAHEAFDVDARLSRYRPDVVDVDSKNDGTPFEHLRSAMENVTPDGAVKKKVVRTGVDVVVPPHAFVTFHYSAFQEYSDEPFDCSVLQGKPRRVKLNSGGLLPGLKAALLTMRRREKADFLVQPSLAYGPLGCPPRISPNAEILFDVELLDWTVTPDCETIEALDDVHLSDSLWEKAKSQASKLHLEGNDWVKNKAYPKALRAYRSAEKIVSNCRLKDEAEEKEHNIFLVKLYCNMAICNYELKNYNEVCSNCKGAVLLSPNHAKAHYYWGLALTSIKDVNCAREHLMKAKKYAPKDKFIHEALSRLDEVQTQQKKESTIFWKRAFQFTEEQETSRAQNQDVTTISSPWKDELIAFKNSSNDSEKRMLLPGGMANDELDALCANVKALNLKINTNNSEYVCVFKD